MRTKEDLSSEIEKLELQLKNLTLELDDVLIGEYKFHIGDVVMNYGNKYTISRIYVRYGSPRVCGLKTLKDGSIGKHEFELYGDITKDGGTK